jgi:lipoprotein-anchoring transpeptidase ErfK/SrfK
MNLAPAFRQITAGPALAAVLLLPGCAVFEGLKSGRTDPQVARAKEQHAAFRAQPGWRKKIYRNEQLIAKAGEANKTVEIALREQRGLLLVDEAIAMDFPVATGRSSHPTPKGSYKILEKKKDHASNLYGRMVGGDGSTVVSDADTRAHAVPAGGRFVGAPMPYWMRMTPTGVGMHVGHVPGHRPASHGCIRLKRETATELFALLDVGTPVKVDSFSPALGGPVGVDSVVIGEVAEKPNRPRRIVRNNPVPAVSPALPTAPEGAAPAANVPAQTVATPAPPSAEVPTAGTSSVPVAASDPAVAPVETVQPPTVDPAPTVEPVTASPAPASPEIP